MSTSPRSLWPREHGAYVQLLVPLVAALAATRPTVSGAAIALGASLAFVASEPLRVALGDRGPRLKELAGPRARRRLALLGASAMTAGGIGLALAPRAAVGLACLIGPPIALVVFLSRRGTVHTVLGECIAAAALAGAAAPVAVAGGMSSADALAMWCAWSLGYVMTVIAVHHVIARHRGATSLPPIITVALVYAALAVLILARPVAWFAIPLAAVATLVLVRPPRATRIRAVGIAFLASSVVSAMCAIATLRP